MSRVSAPHVFRAGFVIHSAVHGGAEPNPIPREIVDYTTQQGRDSSATGRGAGGKLRWAALKRRLDRDDPGYRA